MNICSYIEEKRIEGSLLTRLEQIATTEQTTWEHLLDSLHPSANTLRSLLEIIDEIAQMQKRSPESVIKEEEFSDILNDENYPRKEKQKKLTIYLKKLRYPETAYVESLLEKACLQIRNDLNLTVALPEQLEGLAITLSLQAKSTAELCELSQKLERASKHPAMQKIFDILSGHF